MKNVNQQYQELIADILDKGYEYTDTKRNVQCKQIDEATLRIDLNQGFPAITLKELYFKGVVGELLWFLRGDTNIKYLVDNNINIWNKDAYNYFKKRTGDKSSFGAFIKDVKNDSDGFTGGNLGRVYGAQWRDFLGFKGYRDAPLYDIGIDQISNLIKNLKEQPMSRRHIVTAWNPAELDDMALPPCHWSFEIIVRPLSPLECAKYGKLNKDKFIPTIQHSEYGFTLKWHQRSVDTYLGLPFNIASYALLAHIIGELTGMQPLKLVGDLSNVHLYENSWNASKELLKRDSNKYDLPKLNIKDRPEYDRISGKNPISCTLDNLNTELEISDFKLVGYESYPNIKVEMLAPND